MPSFGRDVLKLAQLAPGSFADGSQDKLVAALTFPAPRLGGSFRWFGRHLQTENGAQVIANGQQSENNGISIDGISTTSAVWGGATIVTPSEDSVDSVKVVSNSYDAGGWRFSGGPDSDYFQERHERLPRQSLSYHPQPKLNAKQRSTARALAMTRDNK